MADRSGKKRKCEPSGPLGRLHEDMLERVLARLPPAAFFRLRGVCRRWRDASRSPSFLAACARAPARDPWFLMLSDSEAAAVAFEAGGGAWAWARRARAAMPMPLPVPVAAAGGLLLYRAPDTGALTVANPLTGAARLLPPPPPGPPGTRLHAVAMYGESPYHVVLILGELPDMLSMAKFDSSTNSWEDIGPLSRTKPSPSSSPASADDDGDGDGDEDEDEDGVGDDGAVYFLSKTGDIMASTVQRSASRQHYAAVTLNGRGGDPVAHFLTDSGAVVACDMSRRVFAELPRVLPAHFEYSIDVVACGDGRALVVVLSELMETASLRVWEFGGDGAGEWRQVAAMPPAMSHAFYGKKADVNCVGHGGRVMVCVSSSSVDGDGGESSGCFVCDVGSNRWEELPRCGGGGEVTDFVAAFSFEPRMEAAV